MFLALACVARHVDVPGEPLEPTAPRGVERAPFAELRDVACVADRCVVMAGGSLRVWGGVPSSIDASTWDTLRAEDDGLVAEGPCTTAPGGRCAYAVALEPPAVRPLPDPPPLPPLEDAPPPLSTFVERWAAAWNVSLANGWRAPFHRAVVAPGGAAITWTRGYDDSGQLIRTSPGRAQARLSAPRSPASDPSWLAIHPTGAEVYLSPWPATTLSARDPVTLAARWTVSFESAAHGLFVSADGRWIVAELGPPDTDRLDDWAPYAVEPAPTHDPWRDEAVRARPRPPATHTVLVDLATHDEAFRAAGSFRRFTSDRGRVVLATDREVVWYTPPTPTHPGPQENPR